MHKAKFGEILENAVRLTGRDVSTTTIPDDWKVLAAMTINEGIRRIAAEKFPMMQRVESRRYRPDYSETKAYAAGVQVWHNGEYWEMVDPMHGGVPGIATGWKQLHNGDYPKFINWEQPWENTIIDRGGVDINRFAYAQNPHYYPNATPIKVVGMSSFGIELQTDLKEVFVKFVPLFPRVKFDEWVSGTLYKAGDVVYRTATKQCYTAMKDITDETKTITPGSDTDETWQEFSISDIFEPYLVKLAASDLLTESQGKFQTQARADAEFEMLCERYHEGNGENKVRRCGRFI